MQGRALFLSLMVITLSLSGCFGEETVAPPTVEEEQVSPRIFVTGRYGEPVDMSPVEMTFQFSDVGETGKAPQLAAEGGVLHVPQQDPEGGGEPAAQ